MLVPQDCKKFDGCSAPICPLDHERLSRVYLRGERLCFYVLEYAKPTRSKLSGVLPLDQLQAVAECYEESLSRCAGMRTALRRASKTPSRMKRPGTKSDTPTGVRKISKAAESAAMVRKVSND